MGTNGESRRGRAAGSRATQFKPGHPGRKKGTGHRSNKAPLLLRDMRAVYRQDEVKDLPRQKPLRQMLKDDPKGYLSQLAQLEKMQAQGTVKGAKSPKSSEKTKEAEPDEGTERAIGLVERLLDGFHAEQAEEDAKLAARPDAAQIGATLQNSLKGALEREEILQRQVNSLRARVAELEGRSCPG